ncbi:MAG: hypothetical protein KAI79_05615 [Bacteroidales bacterium]|nr:hypothetical protein [Bacteroidales bacterium]
MLKEILEKITLETDGGYGDLGVIPSAPNPAIKKKKEDDVEEKCSKDKKKEEKK